MATATTRKAGSNGKAKLTVSLSLAIDHQVYSLEPIRSEDPEITRVWRLTAKASGNVYDVAQTARGATCDCGDYEFRHAGKDALGCKHIVALRLMGLLDAAPAKPTGDWACEEARCGGCRMGAQHDPGFTPPCCPSDELVNQPITVPDVLPDEAPELDPGADFDPAEMEDPDDTGEFDPILDGNEEDERWELGPDPDGPAPTAEDLADAAEIFGEMDAQRHLDRSDRLTLDDLIEHQIRFCEGWQNEAGKWFALHMTELLIKYPGAGSPTTPAEAMARIEILEQDVRQQWEARGYEEGKAAGLREAAPSNGPLD
jgi:hypothetical protein